MKKKPAKKGLQEPAFILTLCIVLVFSSIFSVKEKCYAATPKEKFFEADNCYLQLMQNENHQKYRDRWLKCIEKFQQVYTEDPDNAWASAGMYRTAQLFMELYKRSYEEQDRAEVFDLLNRIIKRYPSSAYAAKAQNDLKSASYKTIKNKKAKKTATMKDIDAKIHTQENSIEEKMEPRSVNNYDSPAVELKDEPAEGGGNDKDSVMPDVFVTGIRHWSTPNYTRVVVDVDAERTFSYQFLDKDPELNKPQRLYLDLDHSRLDKNFPKVKPINDHLLIRARAGQHTPHSVRVVVDIKSLETFKIFSLKDPFRVVIDVWEKKTGDGSSIASSTGTGSTITTPPPGSNVDAIQSSAIAKQLALGVKTIVIDPGHGGKDPGAPGYLKGVHEKNIVLSISKKLAKKMRQRLKCNVLVTRKKDTYLTLEERTAIANTKNADLFISLHCNAARNKKLMGIETYFLNLATDDEAINVAARENATSRKNISDLESILNDLMKNAKINESGRLATVVQENLCKSMAKRYSGIKNLGVKQAPFYVLLGATMPSILIESSFISNKEECKRLVTDKYQNALCDAIIDGVEKYIKETNPRSL